MGQWSCAKQESKTAKDLSRTHPADYANLCGRSSSITGDEVAPSARSLWCFCELRDLVFSRLRGLQKGKLERSAHMIRFRFPELAQIIKIHFKELKELLRPLDWSSNQLIPKIEPRFLTSPSSMFCG